MTQTIKEKKAIGDEIKSHFTNQGWLAAQIGISQSQLSKKMKGTKDWLQEELDAINKVLGTSFKL